MKKRNDLLLISGLLLAAVVIWVLVRPGSTGSWAVVSEDGRETARYALNEDRTIAIGGEAYNILRISGGEAFITEANCGDHTCIYTGAISQEGETIICLPHRLVVRIEGGKASGFDASVG